MKATITSLNPAFTPLKLEILIQNAEELHTLAHICGLDSSIPSLIRPVDADRADTAFCILRDIHTAIARHYAEQQP